MNEDIVTEARAWQQKAVVAWTIYTLLCPITGAARYVGFTANIVTRYKRHLKNGRTLERKYPVNLWINELHGRGLVPDCEVIESGTGEWGTSEAKWISHFRGAGMPLLNVCDGGFFVVPAEARKRAGEKNKGRIVSEEARQHLREHFTGCKRPDAVALGKRMAENNRGKQRVMTDASRRACRENGLRTKSNLGWDGLTPEKRAARCDAIKKAGEARWQAMTEERRAEIRTKIVEGIRRAKEARNAAA